MSTIRRLFLIIILLLLLLGAAAPNLSAHRLDEYLQASRIAIEADQIQLELDLTPGADVADGIIDLMDLDRNGTLSAKERETYARKVVDSLSLAVDGRSIALRIRDVRFPLLEEMRRGEGVIRLRAGAPVAGVRPGPHRLSFSNHHRMDVAAYLVNALVPEDGRIHLTGQSRDMLQRDFGLEYSLDADYPGTNSSALPLLLSAAMAATMLGINILGSFLTDFYRGLRG
jgi:hypothetical protein